MKTERHRNHHAPRCALIAFLVLGFPPRLPADDVATLKLDPVPGMTRAELHYLKKSSTKIPSGVLVLSPGANGSGEFLVRDPQWQKFAEEHHLALVSISFSSEVSDLPNGEGYYYVTKGSGKLLLAGLRRIYARDLPIVLFGFSGGAHFSARFAEWAPERVLVFSAYSAGWWDTPKETTKSMPVGLIVCGDEDPRYGASLMQLKQGRALGRSWGWLSVGGNGHSPDGKALDFIRQFISASLRRAKGDGVFVDIDLETTVSVEESIKIPSLNAWLPSAHLVHPWREINKP